ncbi:hypothetical protein D3C78_1920190 [compost metagenome]
MVDGGGYAIDHHGQFHHEVHAAQRGSADRVVVVGESANLEVAIRQASCRAAIGFVVREGVARAVAASPGDLVGIAVGIGVA